MPKKKRRAGTLDAAAISFVNQNFNLRRIVTSDDEGEDLFSLSPPKRESNVHLPDSPIPSPQGEYFEDSEGAAESWNQLQQSCMTAMSTTPQVVVLNVGGTFYTTSRATLCNRGGMLSAMFSGMYSPYQDEEGRYFIDR